KATFADTIQKLKGKKEVSLLSIFVNTVISKNELSLFPNLRYIITQSTGFDHIDIRECKRRGIRVYNIPDYGTQTVAEYSIFLMMALLRKFRKCESVLRTQVSVTHSELRGKDAYGKTLGVIGCGRIGSQVVRIAHGLGMKVLVHSHRRDSELEQKYGAKFVSFYTLIKSADIISLHLPLTRETKHIINKKTISKMKKGAIIINTARGGLVDVVALAEELQRGKLGGAALDVIESEDLIAHENDILTKKVGIDTIKRAFIGNMLLEFENVILTPHIAYNTEDAIRRIVEKTLWTINEIERGNEELYNLVC
ncbi:MAG: NAD(P)-dependent oxidoreductase, partial [Candidatus Anstonellales archaeon]